MLMGSQTQVCLNTARNGLLSQLMVFTLDLELLQLFSYENESHLYERVRRLIDTSLFKCVQYKPL